MLNVTFGAGTATTCNSGSTKIMGLPAVPAPEHLYQLFKKFTCNSKFKIILNGSMSFYFLCEKNFHQAFFASKILAK
jgi:hypothetical protein